MRWVILAVAVLMSGGRALEAAPEPASGRCRDGRTWTTSAGQQTAMLGLVNQARANAARPPVVRHPVLDCMAMAHAVDMACRDYFDHRNPERQKLEQRLRKVDDGTLGAWQHLAEVIGTSDAANRQLERWLDSRSHKRALLLEEHDRVGVAMVRITGSKWDTYWVVEFAALKAFSR